MYVKTDPAEPLDVELTGRNSEVITIFDAVALRAANAIQYTVALDLSKYKSMDLIIISTLDVAASIGMKVDDSWVMVKDTTYKKWDIISTYGSTVPIDAGGTFLLSTIDLIGAPVFQQLTVPNVKIGIAVPTTASSGSITVKLVGVLN
ncbi:MAG: hypothetical protein WC749_02440 [Dehalococcoidia bacterium]